MATPPWGGFSFGGAPAPAPAAASAPAPTPAPAPAPLFGRGIFGSTPVSPPANAPTQSAAGRLHFPFPTSQGQSTTTSGQTPPGSFVGGGGGPSPSTNAFGAAATSTPFNNIFGAPAPSSAGGLFSSSPLAAPQQPNPFQRYDGQPPGLAPSSGSLFGGGLLQPPTSSFPGRPGADLEFASTGAMLEHADRTPEEQRLAFLEGKRDAEPFTPISEERALSFVQQGRYTLGQSPYPSLLRSSSPSTLAGGFAVQGGGPPVTFKTYAAITAKSEYASSFSFEELRWWGLAEARGLAPSESGAPSSSTPVSRVLYHPPRTADGEIADTGGPGDAFLESLADLVDEWQPHFFDHAAVSPSYPENLWSPEELRWLGDEFAAPLLPGRPLVPRWDETESMGPVGHLTYASTAAVRAEYLGARIEDACLEEMRWAALEAGRSAPAAAAAAATAAQFRASTPPPDADSTSLRWAMRARWAVSAPPGLLAAQRNYASQGLVPSAVAEAAYLKKERGKGKGTGEGTGEEEEKGGQGVDGARPQVEQPRVVRSVTSLLREFWAFGAG
jgi:hypothetical protein